MNEPAVLVAPGSYSEALSDRRTVALLGSEREHLLLDQLERELLDNPGIVPVHLPVKHTFLPGLYVRCIFMPAGAVLTSRCHMTTHRYVVLAGVVEVAIPGQEPVVLCGGHMGITYAGTRRALRIIEDCTWATSHVLSPEEEAARAAGAPETELLAMIEERIIGKREREDGRDVLDEYKGRLAAAGLPGVHDGARALEEGE